MQESTKPTNVQIEQHQLFPKLNHGYNGLENYLFEYNGEKRVRFTIIGSLIVTIAFTPKKYEQPIHYHSKKIETIFFLNGSGKIVYYKNNLRYEKNIESPCLVNFYPNLPHTITTNEQELLNFSIKFFTENDYKLGYNVKNNLDPYIRYNLKNPDLLYLKDKDNNLKKVAVYLFNKNNAHKIIKRAFNNLITNKNNIMVLFYIGKLKIENNIYDSGIVMSNKILNLNPTSETNYGFILNTSTKFIL